MDNENITTYTNGNLLFSFYPDPTFLSFEEGIVYFPPKYEYLTINVSYLNDVVLPYFVIPPHVSHSKVELTLYTLGCLKNIDLFVVWLFDIQCLILMIFTFLEEHNLPIW